VLLQGGSVNRRTALATLLVQHGWYSSWVTQYASTRLLLTVMGRQLLWVMFELCWWLHCRVASAGQEGVHAAASGPPMLLLLRAGPGTTAAVGGGGASATVVAIVGRPRASSCCKRNGCAQWLCTDVQHEAAMVRVEGTARKVHRRQVHLPPCVASLVACRWLGSRGRTSSRGVARFCCCMYLLLLHAELSDDISAVLYFAAASCSSCSADCCVLCKVGVHRSTHYVTCTIRAADQQMLKAGMWGPPAAA
jgi:hypothetical protein